LSGELYVYALHHTPVSGRGIPGRARERGASGLRRYHLDGLPDASDPARREVFVLSRRRPPSSTVVRCSPGRV